MMALVFPGQGSQFVGMGRELCEAFPCAREVFQEVDEALGEKLSALICEGPEDTLTLTQNAQPALMAVSMAVMRVLIHEAGNDFLKRVHVMAGHSLGEIVALTAMGALTLPDAARLLRLRGRAMSDAVPAGTGTMAAILGLSLEQVEALAHEAAQTDVCAVANDNAAGQVVISGHRAAVERAMQLASNGGAKRCVLLNVSGAFHCALMAPAARLMEEGLGAMALASPSVPLIPNLTGKMQKDLNGPIIRAHLVAQITGRVRWRETMEEVRSEGVTVCAEVGPGTVLSGLMRRAIPGIKTFALHKPSEIEYFLTNI